MNKEQKISLLTKVATGSAIACALIAFLMLLNYLLIKQAAPLESTAMEALLERLGEEPNNEALKEEIRNLDLLARKAFFNHQWQMNTGAVLLLAGAVIFGFSLNARAELKKTIEMPEPETENSFLASRLAQRGLWISGATLVLLAAGAAIFSSEHLQSYSPGPEAAPAEGIEVIEVAAAGAESSSSPQPVAEALAVDSSALEAAGSSAAVTDQHPSETEAAPADAITYPGAAAIYSQHASFRGPFGNGVSFHKNIPTQWNGQEGKNILWKAPISGKGNNSPVIWGNRLFLAANSGNSRNVYCYHRESGALLWQQAIKNVPGTPPSPPPTTDDTGLSAPSVATDGIQVYAIFGTGDVAALSLSGQLAWARNLGVPDNHYGHASSLQSWQGKLFVQYDTNEGAKVMALDCSNGNTIWETSREVKTSWASPILASIGGKYQLILSADPLVAGYDPDTGEELWSVDCMMGEVGPSPAYGSGLVFAANEYARLVAINPQGKGAIAWEQNEYLPEVASPVVADGRLYIATSYGVLACYNAKNGEKYWEHECEAGFYASPMIADGKVYALDREGVMHILRNAEEKQLISEPPLGERTVASPAFANGRIYLRGEKHLYCIGK